MWTPKMDPYIFTFKVIVLETTRLLRKNLEGNLIHLPCMYLNLLN